MLVNFSEVMKLSVTYASGKGETLHKKPIKHHECTMKPISA